MSYRIVRALPLQPLRCVPLPNCVLVFCDGRPEARSMISARLPQAIGLASLLLTVNRRTVMNACPHGTLHYPPVDEEAYMKQARFVCLLLLLGIAIVLGHSGVAIAQGTTTEYGIDRPGSDRYSFDMARPEPKDCENVCLLDQTCRA